MAVTHIQPTTIHETPGYSHVAVGAGLAFISGQVALDPNGRLVGAGDVEAQAAQVFANLAAALAAIAPISPTCCGSTATSRMPASSVDSAPRVTVSCPRRSRHRPWQSSTRSRRPTGSSRLRRSPSSPDRLLGRRPDALVQSWPSGAACWAGAGSGAAAAAGGGAGCASASGAAGCAGSQGPGSSISMWT